MATCDPESLLAEGACLNCLTDHQLLVTLNQLYCNGGGGGGGGGDRQVYFGNGDPNGVITPDNTAIANLYYNEDVPGEMWNWSVAQQAWF